MKRTVLWASLLALSAPLSQLAYIDDAQGQRRTRERPQREQAQPQQEEENRYPNAKRENPKPDVNQRTYPKISKAYEQLNEGDVAKAGEALRELEGNSRLTNYERALVYQGLAQVAYESDDVDGAISYWQKAVDSDALPNNDHFSLLYQVAQLQLSEERYDQALATLDRWFSESGASTAEAHALRGNALYRLERYPEAIQALDQAIAANPNPDPTLYELKMAAYYDQEDYAGAARTLEQLIARQPQEVKHQINLAQMYIEMEQNERALQILQKARTEGLLTQPEHWRQLYQLLSYADKPADAAAAINEGMQKGVLKGDQETYRALGDNYYLAEQIDQAIEAYGKAAELSSDGNADQQRGHLLVERERFREAQEALTAAFQKGGLRDEGTAYLLLGEAEQELGNIAAAKQAFEKATGYENSRTNAQLWLKNL